MLRPHAERIGPIGVIVPRLPSVRTRTARLGRLLLAVSGLLLATASVPVPASAAEELTLEAHVLLDGNARIGSWMAIEVEIVNDGASVSGELRLVGGAQGRTRFGTLVDLPTDSRKQYLLYAQPPTFGRDIEIALVDGATTIASTKARFTVRDGNQLSIGIVAERPQRITAGLNLLPDQNRVAPVVMALSPEDLPERVEGWGALDRLVWQDVDSTRLTTAQLSAMRGWIAGGGRLVIVGGTAGPGSFSAFPDALLPYRPIVTVGVAPSGIASLLGDIPSGATDVPALSGDLIAGRALASVGDRVVAGERTYGSGLVTLLGFDPTASWIGESRTATDGLWRRVLPTRTSAGLVIGEDSQLVNAVSQLPALALPPTGGLLALLAAYILLVGPINYLVLRKLDRREWAWVTMPALIAVFAAGAYGFGAALRGSDVIVNEIAIVRGTPGTTDGTAYVYLGVFSPNRGTYQVLVPGGALLSSPLAGDIFGEDGTQASLDVLQGEPSRVRDLTVGFGSLRAIRAETSVAVPLIDVRLELVDGRLRGTVRNDSSVRLQKPAVVLGATIARLADLEPGETATVDVAAESVTFGDSLSNRILGQLFFGDPSQAGSDVTQSYVRHAMIDQLTFDPNFGSSNLLPAEGPVVLAWGTADLLDVRVEGQEPRRTGNVLYFLPTTLQVRGSVAFRSDLMRSTVIETDAPFFSKDPYSISFGRGSATLSFRPVTFEGTVVTRRLALNLGWGGDVVPGAAKELEPLDAIPPPCDPETDVECQNRQFDGIPEIELFDRSADGGWRRFPHLQGGLRYAIKDADRYVEPGTGSVLIRLVNDKSEGVGFSLSVELEGDIR